MVLADLVVVYLAHLDRKYFHLRCCHLLHRFTDSAPVRQSIFFLCLKSVLFLQLVVGLAELHVVIFLDLSLVNGLVHHGNIDGVGSLGIYLTLHNMYFININLSLS